jgi:hypothetical protein
MFHLDQGLISGAKRLSQYVILLPAVQALTNVPCTNKT